MKLIPYPEDNRQRQNERWTKYQYHPEYFAVLDGEGLHYKGRFYPNPRGREIFSELIEA